MITNGYPQHPISWCFGKIHWKGWARLFSGGGDYLGPRPEKLRSAVGLRVEG